MAADDPPAAIARGEDPLTRSIVRRVMVPLLIAILVFVIPLGWFGVRDARNQVVELTERQATIVALLAGGAPEILLGPDAALDRFTGVEGEVAALLNRRGDPIAGGELPDVVLDSPVVDRALAGQIASDVDRSGGVVVGGAPVVLGGDVVGAAVVAVPDDAIGSRTRTVLGVLAAVTLALLAAAALAGRSLARRIVRPIEDLDRVAARLAQGELSARAVNAGAPPELRRLAETLNESADELQRLLALQRSFVADASHQLRTPLAGLRLRLENAQMTSGDPDGRLAAAIDEVDRLTALVGDLLTLARAERGEVGPQAVDAAEVVRARADVWAPLAAEQRVEVRFTGPSSAPSWVVPGGLEQVIDNLVANALRVAPAGSVIDLDVEAEARAITCRVADRGPGMSVEHRGRAFERFWRAPGSGSDGGSGLGLPIAAQLVRASGGTIALQARPGGGLIAEVRLPRADAVGPPPPPAADVPGGQGLRSG